MGVFDERNQQWGAPWEHMTVMEIRLQIALGDVTLLNPIVALQYHLHLVIIYCTFKEKWVLEAFIFKKWDDRPGKQMESKHLRFLRFFHALINLLEQIPCFFASHGFLPPLPSLINKMTHKWRRGVSFAL